MKKIVLAFDIERSGAFNTHDTLAIGAAVVNENFEILDKWQYNGYVKDQTIFEKRCYDEFWSKNLETLESLTYTGELTTKREVQKEMITQFQDFRKKWQEKCDTEKIELYLVTDNSVFDGGFVNQLIFEHLEGTMPIPYNTNGSYETFFETTSVMKGFALAYGKTGDWGFKNMLKDIIVFPVCPAEHDHSPANDATTIAFDAQTMLNQFNHLILFTKPSYILGDLGGLPFSN